MTLTVCNTAGESVQLADHPFAQGGEAAVYAVHAATLTASTVAKDVFDLANGNIGAAELCEKQPVIALLLEQGDRSGSRLRSRAYRYSRWWRRGRDDWMLSRRQLV